MTKIERKYGIQVLDRAGDVLGTLWQHLTPTEIEAEMADMDGGLAATMADWTGEWEPAQPDFTLADTYEIDAEYEDQRTPHWCESACMGSMD